jgi:hypothetical protein
MANQRWISIDGRMAREKCGFLKCCWMSIPIPAGCLFLFLFLFLSTAALLFTSFGRTVVESVTSSCTLIISIDGEAQCLRVHNSRHTDHHSHTDSHHVVDAVFSWVNPTDPGWRLKRRNASGTTFGNFGADDLSDARRFNNGGYPDVELCASLELLLTNMPWLRHVWVLTMRPQRPTCVHPKMRVVHHDEVGLPVTFNIFSIETRLQNIPGLSERFVYMNDDFYVMNPMPVSAFFALDGRPIAWTEPLDIGHIFRTCVHNCDVTNRLVLPLMHGKRMLSLLHGPKGLTISMLKSTVSHPSLKDKAYESTRRIMRSYDDFMTIVAAQNLAVVSGTALLSTSIPTFEMVDTVPRVPFRRSVDIACINGAVFNTAEDVALFRKALWLKP